MQQFITTIMCHDGRYRTVVWYRYMELWLGSYRRLEQSKKSINFVQ